jgi:hypothetical protein
MAVLDYVITAIWLSPFLYFGVFLLGKLFNHTHKSSLIKRKEQAGKKVGKIIFQIPTVGNVGLVNKIFDIVKKYDLPVPLETWVVVEESDPHKTEYSCDKVIVVPGDFGCEDLYKARALEFARRERQRMVANGELEPNYMLLQGDDDSLPSREFIKESLTVNADICIGSLTPESKSVWTNILEYERCVTCDIFCDFFTNIQRPLWAHGEATCLTSAVDKNVSYDVSCFNRNFKGKLVSSEDIFYIHKASLMGYRVFNSEKHIAITSPLTYADAIRQRRRWVWGDLHILSQKMLPLRNRLRLSIIGFSGMWLYSFAMIGLPLNYFGLVSVPPVLIPFCYLSLAVWLGQRAYIIGSHMGWKHAIIGALTSYITVTLSFATLVIGYLKGDPKKFEVIRKE